jgi:hypothetical protein
VSVGAGTDLLNFLWSLRFVHIASRLSNFLHLKRREFLEKQFDPNFAGTENHGAGIPAVDSEA